MALANLGELRGAVADYLARPASDINAQFAVAVEIFESKFSSTTRVADMETAITLPVSNGIASLPSDFLELRNVVDSSGSTFGSYYLSGFSLVFPSNDPNDDSISEVTVLYYARVPALVNDTDTNWLLTLYPHLYLYGVMVEMGPWLVDASVLTIYTQMYEKALSEFKSGDVGKRWGGMQVIVQGPTP
jgi:hypothetical protein